MLFLLLVISGCATAPQSRLLLQQQPEGLPLKVELASTPFFPQQAYQCGPAALATVLNAQQVVVAPKALADRVYIPEREGSLQIEMISAARDYGMVVYPLAPRLDHLLKEIAAGNPVLLLQNLALDWYPNWHYSVAVGYDLKEGVIILRSGTMERRITRLATFEQTWQRGDHWARVLLPPGQFPVTAEPLAYIQAVHGLEQSRKQQLALVAYRSAAQQWSDNKTALMAWGNAEYGAGNTEQAEIAFRQVIKHHPHAANAWNNLAYVLSTRECGSAAQRAIDCALQLAPDDINIQGSARELSKISGNNKGGCRPVECPLSINH